MSESEIAFWLRTLNTAKEMAILQSFSDGSTITVVDVVRSRFLSLGLRLEYDEKRELYYVVAFS